MLFTTSPKRISRIQNPRLKTCLISPYCYRIRLKTGQYTIINLQDYSYTSQLNWYPMWKRKRRQQKKHYFVTGTIQGKTTFLHRHIMEKLELLSSGLEVDHINRDTSDNRRSNLRVCTPQQNSCNRGKTLHTSSQYKGVSWFAAKNKWIGMIQANNQRHYLGLFIDETEAAKAYDEKARELHGEFASLNFPDEK